MRNEEPLGSLHEENIRGVYLPKSIKMHHDSRKIVGFATIDVELKSLVSLEVMKRDVRSDDAGNSCETIGSMLDYWIDEHVHFDRSDKGRKKRFEATLQVRRVWLKSALCDD
jgi:hypothetical protein